MRGLLLKLCSIFLLLSLLNENGQSQTLPDHYYSSNYTFTKSWVDDFDKKESRWSFADWTFDNNLCEFNPSSGSLTDGKLNLTIQKKQEGNMGNAPTKPYWGAEYGTSSPTLYGRYIVNLKPTVPKGVVTSFFLNYIYWNNDYTVPQEWYEIDIEFAGKTDEVQFTLHWIDNTGKHMNSKTVDLDFDASADFHQWAIEWTPAFIKFYVDDELLHTFDDPTLLKEQEHAQNIQMNNWVSDSEEWVGKFDEVNLPVTAQYDYVAYYTLDNPTTSINEKSPYSISVTQNDSAKQFLIKGSDVTDIHFNLFDINGKLINEGKATDGLINLSPALPKGIYLLELRKKDWKGTYKMIL